MKVVRIIFSLVTVFVMITGINTEKALAVSDKDITAPSAVLMDASTGEVLYAKEPHQVRACASITKVMTLTLVMEALDSGKIKWSDKVTASEHASSMGGSDIWLEPGETMTVEEMVKATAVASANDAAVALAEHICGSEDEFVRRMNEKAKKLGMKETTFKNCNGLDEEGHLTSAYDVALMSRELIKHRGIFKFTQIWMDELRGGKTQIVNTNKLLKSYRGITGLKTGTTSQAGSCITATAERDGLSLIAVVLGSSSGKDRFKDAAALLDYGFANYAMYKPQIPEGAVTNIPVTGGLTDRIATGLSINDSFLIKKGGEGEISYDIDLPDTIEAPVQKGQTVGRLIIKNGDHRIAEYPITAASEAAEIKIWDIFRFLLCSLTGS